MKYAIAFQLNGETVGYLRILKNGCKVTKSPHKYGGVFDTFFSAFNQLVFNADLHRMYISYEKKITEIL